MIKGRGTYTGDKLYADIISGLIPPYPGAGIVNAVFIPTPPLLAEGLTDVAIANKLAAAYRGAVSSVYNRRCWVLTRGDIAKTKQFSSLVVAGDFLRAKGVAPICWAKWSATVWSKWKGVSKNPPVHWVYAITRLDQKLDEFKRDNHIVTPKVSLTPTHRQLLKIYSSMVEELANASTNSDRKLVVAKHFPSGLYDRLVSRVNNETAAIQQRLQQRIDKGEWIWTST